MVDVAEAVMARSDVIGECEKVQNLGSARFVSLAVSPPPCLIHDVVEVQAAILDEPEFFHEGFQAK